MAHHPKSGPNFVPAYQTSAVPFITSSGASEVQGVDSNTAGGSPEPIAVEFPYVTKYITVRNTGVNELRLGFSSRGMFAPGEHLPASMGGTKGHVSNGDNRNYFLIPTGSGAGGEGYGLAGSIQTFDVRCREVFFVSNAAGTDGTAAALCTSFSLFAGLTTISRGEFPVLTGTNSTGTGSFQGVG